MSHRWAEEKISQSDLLLCSTEALGFKGRDGCLPTPRVSIGNVWFSFSSLLLKVVSASTQQSATRLHLHLRRVTVEPEFHTDTGRQPKSPTPLGGGGSLHCY
eukprot:6070937-Amphidinium_carterae.1